MGLNPSGREQTESRPWHHAVAHVETIVAGPPCEDHMTLRCTSAPTDSWAEHPWFATRAPIWCTDTRSRRAPATAGSPLSRAETMAVELRPW